MDVPLLNMRSMENVAPCVPPVQYKCLIQILYDKCWNTLDAERQSQFAAFRQTDLTKKQKHVVYYEYRLSFLASGYDSI